MRTSSWKKFRCKRNKIRHIGDLVRYGKHVWFRATYYDRESDGILFVSGRTKKDEKGWETEFHHIVVGC